MKPNQKEAIKTIVPRKSIQTEKNFYRIIIMLPLMPKHDAPCHRFYWACAAWEKQKFSNVWSIDYFLNKIIKTLMQQFLFSFSFQMKQLHVIALL